MNFALDTNIILYHMAGQLTAPLPSKGVFTSVICEIELLSFPNLDPSEEQAIGKILDIITVVDLTVDVKLEAVRLRRRHRLKLADAIVAATAVALNAELLTNDHALLSLLELRSSHPARNL